MHTIIRIGLPALFAASLLAAPASAQSGATPVAPPAAAPVTPGAVTEKQFDIPRVGDKEGQIELISGLCAVQMKEMSPPACRCLATEALTRLSDPQRDYMIATVVSPPVADRMLADRRVGQVDQQVIFAFLDATSAACATGTFDASKPAPAFPPAATPVAPSPAPEKPAQ
ncbi:hypothetical protein Sa4125_41690 [Aureimonas sp. SA4125]|uniref:hypothetical protein n=1 Tax=Aureimonas sp. SA4125 TaxID=2826993 RepID=UPI001CC4F3A0|nr:hypothetical protein [Aureimonas sp. SA4125]BDA86627.1 hypothetical protein Sa4125_41690 [Aureimonas sp. SA4125]